jgi:hypothetical protein
LHNEGFCNGNNNVLNSVQNKIIFVRLYSTIHVRKNIIVVENLKKT